MKKFMKREWKEREIEKDLKNKKRIITENKNKIVKKVSKELNKQKNEEVEKLNKELKVYQKDHDKQQKFQNELFKEKNKLKLEVAELKSSLKDSNRLIIEKIKENNLLESNNSSCKKERDLYYNSYKKTLEKLESSELDSYSKADELLSNKKAFRAIISLLIAAITFALYNL